jgi:hypothetical protein
MSGRLRVFVLPAALAIAACGEPTDGTPPGEPGAKAPAAAASLAVLPGSYSMEGTTVEVESGRQRKISGTVILSVEGSSYTATFALKTTYPTPDGPLPADVIGKGSGVVEGASLKGTAQTQLVMATVPGVDTGFAFVPRMVGPRIVSKSVGALAADGTLTIEVENEPAPGEVYPPTRTTLKGVRLAEGEAAPKS